MNSERRLPLATAGAIGFLLGSRFKWRYATVVVAVVGLIIGAVYVVREANRPFFDPTSGEPMFRYSRAADGKITLFPRETAYHPETRAPLPELTPEIAREYRRQRGKETSEDRAAALRDAPPPLRDLLPIQTVSAWNLAIDLYWCSRTEQGFACTFTVRAPATPATTATIELVKRGSRMVDENGGEYLAVRVELGSDVADGESPLEFFVPASADAEITSGTAVSGRILFPEVSPAVSQLQLVTFEIDGGFLAWWKPPWGERQPSVDERNSSPFVLPHATYEFRDVRIGVWRAKRASADGT